MVTSSLKFVTGMGSIIDFYRKQGRYNPEQLGEMVNKDKHAVNAWISNRVGVPINDINKMINVFGPEFEASVKKRIRTQEDAAEEQKKRKRTSFFKDKPETAPVEAAAVPLTPLAQPLKAVQQGQDGSKPEKLETPAPEEAASVKVSMPEGQTPASEKTDEAETAEAEEKTTAVISKGHEVWNFAVKYLLWASENGEGGLLSGLLEKGEAACRKAYDESVRLSEYVLGEIVRVISDDGDKYGLVTDNDGDMVEVLIGDKTDIVSKERIRHTGKKMEDCIQSSAA